MRAVLRRGVACSIVTSMLLLLMKFTKLLFSAIMQGCHVFVTLFLSWENPNPSVYNPFLSVFTFPTILSTYINLHVKSNIFYYSTHFFRTVNIIRIFKVNQPRQKLHILWLLSQDLNNSTSFYKP